MKKWISKKNTEFSSLAKRVWHWLIWLVLNKKLWFENNFNIFQWQYFSFWVKKVKHGTIKCWHGAREVTYDARKVSIGARKWSQGTRNVLHVAKKVSNDDRKVSHGAYQTKKLWKATMQEIADNVWNMLEIFWKGYKIGWKLFEKTVNVRKWLLLAGNIWEWLQITGNDWHML